MRVRIAREAGLAKGDHWNCSAIDSVRPCYHSFAAQMLLYTNAIAWSAACG